MNLNVGMKSIFSSSRNLVPRSGIQDNMRRGESQQSEPGPHGPPKTTEEDFEQLRKLGSGSFGKVMQFCKYPNMLSFLKRFLQIYQIIVKRSFRYCNIVDIRSNCSMGSDDICVQIQKKCAFDNDQHFIPGHAMVLLIPKPNKECRKEESQLLFRRFPMASGRRSGYQNVLRMMMMMETETE